MSWISAASDAPENEMKHGQFVWYEIMTTQTEAATAFYERVIGWSAADSGMPGPAYTLLSAGQTMVGGLMAIPDEARVAGMQPRWMGYIGVDDVDTYAKRVAAAGGAVHRAPADIPGVGRFAVVADLYGASFVLFKGSGTPPAPAALGTPGHIRWHELHAGHCGEAFDWYAGLFGWTKDQAIDMREMGVYQTFSTGSGPAVGGMTRKRPDRPVPFWLFYFSVDAIDAAAARVADGGGKVAMGPVEVLGGAWVVQCTDPQGALFAMVAPKR